MRTIPNDPHRMTARECARQQRALAALGFTRRPRPNAWITWGKAILSSALGRDRHRDDLSYDRWTCVVGEVATAGKRRIAYGPETHDAWRSGETAAHYVRRQPRTH